MKIETQKWQVVNDPTVNWLRNNWKALNEVTSVETEINFGFLSIPFDYAVSYRPGTRFGPEKILEVLNTYSTYCSDKRICVASASLFNFNTVEVCNNLQVSYNEIEKDVFGIPSHITPIILGGDHSITDPCFRGMKKRFPNKDMGLVMFDAHYDFRVPQPGKEHSGHWLKTLENTIDYSKVVILGISAPIYSEYYTKTLEEKGCFIRTPYEIRKKGLYQTILEVNDFLAKHCDGIYVTIDIDAIDQSYVTGTSVPNPSGLHTYEIMDSLFEICASNEVLGMDIVEVSPPLEKNENATAHIAANIILNFMAGKVRHHHSLSSTAN